MLKAGKQVKAVSDRLGHSSSNLILDTYAHVLPRMNATAADRFNRTFDEVDPRSQSR